MTITRNGIEIELTWQEIREAYLFWEHECFKEDIVSRAEDMEIDLSNHDINKIADRVDKALSHNDFYWDSYWTSIEHVLDEISEEG